MALLGGNQKVRELVCGELLCGELLCVELLCVELRMLFLGERKIVAEIALLAVQAAGKCRVI